MTARYVVIPAHAVRHAMACEESLKEATDSATSLVEKDRIPRVVVQIMTEVSASPKPRIEVNRHKEVSNVTA